MAVEVPIGPNGAMQFPFFLLSGAGQRFIRPRPRIRTSSYYGEDNTLCLRPACSQP